jgi:hypothetical protein
MMLDTTRNPASQEIPIACSLSAEELSVRREEIARTILAGYQEVVDLPDGYAVRFPGNPTWAEKLLAFVVGERACCEFFTFELTFEAQQGPIWLSLRGPEGTKEVVASMLVRSSA